MKVCVGGTFYPLHNGHKQLLRKAFELAGPKGFVLIGLTTTAMIQKKGQIASYKTRESLLLDFLEKEHVLPQVSIKPLRDKYGPTIQGDFDAIVVSPETKKTAEKINRKRAALKKKPLQIIVIPFVLSEDGKPVSSTRIRRNEIDETGKNIQQE